MADDNANNEDDTSNGGESHDDERSRQAFADRDKAKNEAKQLKQRVAEYEAKERKAAEQREREAGDFAAVEKRYQAQLADIQAQLEGVTGERDGLIRTQRQGAIVDRLAAEAGIGNRRLLERLLPDTGLADHDPTAITKADVNNGIKRLREVAPELFATTTTKKPPPEGGEQYDKNDPQYWRDVGRRATTGSDTTVYAKATGKTS